MFFFMVGSSLWKIDVYKRLQFFTARAEVLLKEPDLMWITGGEGDNTLQPPPPLLLIFLCRDEIFTRSYLSTNISH